MSKRKVTYFDRSMKTFAGLEARFDAILFQRDEDEESHGVRNTAIGAAGLGVAGAGGLYARGRDAMKGDFPDAKRARRGGAGGVMDTIRRGATEIPNDVRSMGNRAMDAASKTKAGQAVSRRGLQALDYVGPKLDKFGKKISSARASGSKAVEDIAARLAKFRK